MILLSLMLVFGTMCAVPAFAGESAEDLAIGSIDDLYYLENLVEDRAAGSADISGGAYNVTLMTDLDHQRNGMGRYRYTAEFLSVFSVLLTNGHTITCRSLTIVQIMGKGGLFN